jgi:hypothetical protein
MDDRLSGRVIFVATSIAAIWLATLAASLYAPALITGAQQEHIPLVAAVDWLWAALATGLVALAAGLSERGSRAAWIGSAVALVAIWVAMAVASIAGPELVTGSDPTRVPLAAILSPFAAVVATAYVAIFAAALGGTAEALPSGLAAPSSSGTPASGATRPVAS